jgi:hypothetical protein
VNRLSSEPMIVTVTARTIQARDVIWIGGRRTRVETVTRLHNGARCRLAGGDLLSLSNGREYTVERPATAPATQKKPLMLPSSSKTPPPRRGRPRLWRRRSRSL